MPQATNELQGAFNGQFTGLDLSSAVGNIPPNGSAVFHNCDVSSDGSVIRRGGTLSIASIDTPSANRPVWTSSIRTRNSSTYVVSVSDASISVLLMRDVVAEQTARIIGSVTKNNIWTAPLSSVCFIATASPYDRLLLLTPEHPIVQLSFLERSFTTVCASNTATTGTFLSALAPNDSTLWNDTNISSYIVTDDVTGVAYPVTTKLPGFSFTLLGTFVAGTTYTLTIRQITWQWWAESLYWEGADITQTVSRFNVTDADQNVKVPSRLITDLDPIYVNSAEIGLRVSSTSSLIGNTYNANFSTAPPTENHFGFSNGSRYTLVANNVLSTSPFFVTFGARQAAGGVGQAAIARLRELRFNGGAGVTTNNLSVTVSGKPYAASNAVAASQTNTYFPGNYAYTATERSFVPATVGTSVATLIFFFNDPFALPFSAPVILTNKGSSTLFGTGQQLWYRDITSTGGNLDGRYVNAFGIGAFVDYSKRSFHSTGIISRGRLILQNPQSARDQLLCSGVNDEQVAGEYYQFFQITDALLGLVEDPFTINVTSDGRERITALVTWQQSVFVFTNSNTYSIVGGEQFSESNYSVNLVSTYGAFNNNCVLVTNLTVLYMNRFGLFDLLNKPNSDNYGAVERSAKVRKLFNEEIVSVAFDGIHWLQYNEATNRVYVGLGVLADTLSTSRNLALNVSWEAWSTLASVVPFKMLLGVQAFSYTLFVAETSNAQYYSLLCADMPFYLDFATYVTFTAFPVALRMPLITQTYAADSRGIVNTPQPATPGIVDYQVANSGKVGKVYARLDGTPTPTLVRSRNPMVDYPSTLALCGGNSLATPFATVSLDSSFTSYCSFSTTGTNPNTVNLTAARSFNTALPISSPNAQQLVGVCYASVYASPVFDLDALGRLKRLRRLHLLFDTTIAGETFYFATPTVRILNGAFVTVISNHQDGLGDTEICLVGDSILRDSMTLDTPAVARGNIQHSISLQGYGCDYQFYVSSVGAETFKLASYEFEVQAARDKRYTRP